MAVAVSDEQIERLLPVLENAARADPDTPKRFVSPRPGILEVTAARRHHFVFGRRGAGKSTLLRKIEQDSERLNAIVLFIDVETLRGRPYPDVLIELLIELLAALGSGLSSGGLLARARSTRTRLRLKRLKRTLGRLLGEPQEAEHTVRSLQKKSATASAGAGVDADAADAIRAHAYGEASASKARETETAAHFTRTKMEGLLAAAVQIRKVLEDANTRFGDTPTLVVLDDFYHVSYEDQPRVLAYLHQVVKNLPIHLKICGVRHRIKPFIEGDPPTGLQLGHDAGEISVDITLEDFPQAQRFLEKVLDGICDEEGVSTSDLVTETGRVRLILGSGGVARDYIDLVSKSLRKATERPANTARPHNRITAEDINESAADISTRKQNDLATDAGPDADRLRQRLTDIVVFCLDRNKTNVFLVEGTDLQEREWGQAIQALADLRLVHQLGNLTVPWGPYRGRRFVGFTLDLSHWTGTRSEQIRQIEFWKPGGRGQLRRAGLIYTPDRASESTASSTSKPETSVPRSEPVDWDQPALAPESGDSDDFWSGSNGETQT